VLLNSHIDTVRPSSGWQTDPFTAIESEDKIFGLGSNDAGASVVSQLTCFIHFYRKELPFNLIYSATAEEEISGQNGVESILHGLGRIDLVIVGEPTNMEMAVAERGLMVLDCTVEGKAGHAAHNEGLNAIYQALPVIDWFKNLRFPIVSDWLGEVKTTVTQISAGKQHNVVPDCCRFVVDVRTNGMYTNQEILDYIRFHAVCKAEARSLRLNSSNIQFDHPVIAAAKKCGLKLFGSKTTSDQAVIPWPSVKIGPGNTFRSHAPNEFICIDEIKQGIQIYIELIENLHFNNFNNETLG
jgi:acetylornithine deacetylase